MTTFRQGDRVIHPTLGKGTFWRHVNIGSDHLMLEKVWIQFDDHIDLTGMIAIFPNYLESLETEPSPGVYLDEAGDVFQRTSGYDGEPCWYTPGWVIAKTYDEVKRQAYGTLKRAVREAD